MPPQKPKELEPLRIYETERDEKTLEPLNITQKPSTVDWWIEQALRTVPPVVGGFIGGAAGLPATPFTAGGSSVGGAMVGAGAGGALGNILGNWYSGRDFNPAEFGIDVVSSAAPEIFGPIKYAGKGLPAILEYAGKHAVKGAAEGGLVSGVSTPFQYAAQTGNFNAPLSAYAQNIGAGLAMGAGTGGTIGAWHGRALNAAATVPPRIPSRLPPGPLVRPEPQPLAHAEQTNLPFEHHPAFEPSPYGRIRPDEPEIPPSPMNEQLYKNADIDRNTQQKLFELQVEQARADRYGNDATVKALDDEILNIRRNAALSKQMGSEPGQGHLPFESGQYEGGTLGPTPFEPKPTLRDLFLKSEALPSLRPDIRPPMMESPVTNARPRMMEPEIPAEQVTRSSVEEPNIPSEQLGEGNPRVVTIKQPDPAIIKILRSKGYVSVPDLRSPEGHPQMVRGDLAPLYRNAETRPAPEAGVPPPVGTGALPARTTSVNRPEMPHAFTEGEVAATDTVSIPNAKVNNEFIKNMAEGGYTPSEKGTTHTTFVKNEGPLFARVGDRIKPDEYRRGSKDNFEVYDTNTDKVHSYWPTEDMARRASEKLGRDYPEMDYRASPERTPREVLTFNQGEEPSFAKVAGGGLTASVDIRRAVENITKDYTSPLPGVMTREGLQNALDAADKLGTNGDVKIRINERNKTIEIHDNGSGLDEEALSKKLVEIFATGKEGEEGATGGKGIGSASYIYGGQHFKIETVAVDRKDGIKYRIMAGGTPQQFLDPVKGSDWSKTPISRHESTGTTIQVTLKDEHDIIYAHKMVNNIVENSRNRPSRILVDDTSATTGLPLSDIEPDGDYIREHRFESSNKDKLIGDFTTVNRNSEVKILIPDSDTSVERSDIAVHYLNNGMYQFSENIHLGQGADGVPEKVLVDIHPLVDDQNELYPFINTREDIKKDIREEVNKFITDNISKPGISRRKNRVQELYNSMSPVPIQGTVRKSIIFDPGKRLTSREMEVFTKSPVVQELIRTYDTIIHDIVQLVGRDSWVKRLEGVGLVLDPNMHGVHIPNPASSKSTILINPFIRIESGMDPKMAAWENVITNLHEVAHIGHESGALIKLNPKDLMDPRVGEFLSSYMNQLVSHGDVNAWRDTGHGMGFAHRLGEVYAKFGVSRTYEAANTIHEILTRGSKSGSYSPEVQRLLQLYTESRGRDATTEDLLSGTGVKQSNNQLGGKGNIPGNNPTNGTGTAANKVKETNFLREALAVPTNLTTTMDLSPPGRQGLSMILTPQFWRAAGAMFKGLSPSGFAQIDAELRSKPLFQKKIDPNTGKVGKSLGEQIGMKLFSPASKPGPRAENTASRWLEQGIGEGIGSKIWRNTAGIPIRMSNRGYITFLNHLNANRTEYLMNKARDMSIKAFDTGKARQGFMPIQSKFTKEEAMDLNPYHNLVLGKEIADFVNTATGHGPLKTHLLPFKQAEVSMESAADKLGYFLFSPGLLASRVRMLNPNTYIMATPFVRKQYLKAAMSTVAAWYTFTELAKLAGGDDVDVSNNWTSADFGKIRIGNARLDAGGGFLQFAVAAGRLFEGGSTSSSSGKFHRFGSGYQAQTQEDMMQRFVVNKLNPVTKFAYDVMTASEYNPFHVGDRTAQLFVPLFIQDLMEIGKENPDLLPGFGGAALFGGGTQIYSKGESVSKFIDPKNDWLVKGGGIRDLIGMGPHRK